MTREEIERSFQYNMTDAFIEWDKAVNAEYREENEEAFYQGAYASQKYLIKKACEWLRENMSRYVSKDDPDKFPYGFPTRAFRVDVNFECDFKKAMEE